MVTLISRRGNKIGKIFLLTFSVMLMAACEKVTNEVPKELGEILTDIKTTFAPDRRVALFDIIIEKDDDQWIFSGETNVPEAKETLLNRLTEENIAFTDNITLLPHEALGEHTFGVVRNSVSNIRSAPRHSAELATQATLGMPLKVLKKEGDWYLVQTPDQYIAWIDYGGFMLMTAEDFDQWMEKPKLIITQRYGTSRHPMDRSKTVSDLVLGDVLALLEEQKDAYLVQYPDGREALIDHALAKTYHEWLSTVTTPNPVEMIAMGESFLGIPYLWGGTSTKGMDCSGFTKTIYLMQGIIIPRDASQQVHEGKLVDTNKNWDELAKGDLLFFGKAKTDSTGERVTHVGIWMGENRFIHASGDGLVKINSVNPEDADYDSLNTNRYLKTKRLINIESPNTYSLQDNNIFHLNRL